MNNILKITSSSFILLTSLLLTGCEEEKEEIKQEATEVKKDVKQALTQTWQDAKESGKEFKDESLTQLIDETKALGHTLATEGKAFSKDFVEDSKGLVEQGKEMASDATDEAKKAADELAKKIKEQREAIENSN